MLVEVSGKRKCLRQWRAAIVEGSRLAVFTKNMDTRMGVHIFGGEGGTRTLAPVTRPTPLAGAPRHQLEYFSNWLRLLKVFFFIRLCLATEPLAERVGFEPTVRCRTTVFKTVPL